MDKWKDANVTLPAPDRRELEALLAPCSTALEIPAKKVFLKPGDRLNGVYYVAEGRTRHYIIGVDGAEKALYTLSAGWFYGETPCTLDDPTGLYSKTEVKSRLLCIPLGQYERLLNENEMFRNAILYSYAKKLRILRQEIENLVFSSCKDRLKRLYCTTADTAHTVDGQWYDMKVNYTQYEIGTIVGAARVTVSKLINELCDDGFLRIVNRRTQIHIPDYEAETARRGV